MKEKLFAQLLEYIENLEIETVAESQLHIAIGFIKTLFNIQD